MANSSPSGGNTDDTALSQVEAELLQNVLDPEQSAPWLATNAAEEYTTQLETAGQTLEISDEEATQGWQKLSATLGQLWGDTASQTLLAQLQAKFAERLPSTLLMAISEKAQQVAQSGQPMAKQLITCVRDSFTNLAEADLQVMARPMAFAMRGSSTDEFIDVTLRSVREDDWAALSPIEQAKLSLAAARYAIAHVEIDERK